MGAHVTADATEQWIQLDLRHDVVFDLHVIGSMVPDCGYQLRRIEVEAIGKLTAQHFIFESNGLSFDLKMPVGSQGHGYVTGRFEAPIDKNPAFEVDAFVVHAERLPQERQ